MPWNAAVLDMPIWAFHGVDDAIVSVNQSDEMVSKLQELDKDVEITITAKFEVEGKVILTKDFVITIKAEEYNSDDVVLYVEVIDNAGNVSVDENGKLHQKAFKIDITAPKIDLSYNIPSKEIPTINNVGIYNEDRVATIVLQNVHLDLMQQKQMKVL